MTAPFTRSTRRRLAMALIGTTLAVAVSACGGTAATTAPTASAAASASGSAAPIQLDGTSWRLTDYLSPDGALFTVPAAVTPLAAFAAGTMSGNAGCNTFNGPYTITGQDIALGPLMSTKMACQEPIASVENAYLAALNVVDKVAILDNGKLQLWDSEGKTTLAFVAVK